LFTVTTLPSEGQLSTLGGAPVQVGQIFLGAPTLLYEPGAAREGVGNDSFTYTVTDAGGPGGPLSDAATVAVSITQAVANGQVTMSGGIVRVGGTSAANDIQLARTLAGKLQVRIGGQLVSGNISLSSVNEIRVWGREGDDMIVVLLIDKPTRIHGGAGDDNIVGGLGANLIFGGAGADKLVGGLRNDLLIGGAGADLILDAIGDDVLVGGNVSNRLTDDFFREVLSQWARGQSPNERFKQGLTDDGAIDSLFDVFGDDWFALGHGDLRLDLNPFDDDLVTVL
jgi:Ca2+-binding RTX toxin-like protein